MLSELLQLLVNGLTVGAILGIGAVGVTLVLGLLRLLHVAHGDMLTFGAYAALALAGATGSLVIGAIAAAILTAVLAVVLDLILWGPMRRRGAGFVSLLLASIGLAFVLRHLILLIAGAGPRQYEVDLLTVYSVAGIRLSQGQVIALAVSTTVILLVGYLFARTALGKAMRAMADDPDLAAVAGVDVNRTILMIWVLSGALAGLAGTLQGLVQNSFNPNLGFTLLLPVFAAVILGGIGSVYGALFGGVALGLAMELSGWQVLLGGVPSAYKQVVAFAVLIGMLLIRPSGFFGTVELR